GAAAAMSTANSQIHAVSTIVTLDIYQRYMNPKASQQSIMKVGRWSLVLFSLIAYFMALVVPGVLITIGIAALAGTAQLIVPTIGAISWKKSHPTAAIWGLSVGVLTVVALTFIPAFTSAPFGFHAGVWALLVNVIIFVSLSLLLKRKDTDVVNRFVEARNTYNAEYHPEAAPK
ncbi:hypothetical protein J4G37_45100, partial [Microvirga sp. 3-52]|nr:hypothetical protein [Microvirga sp. 3-52]